MLIGRKREVEALNNLYASDSAELVALYGRRRVGKTFLVDEVFRDKITFRHAGLSPIDERRASGTKRKSPMKDQLRHFYHSLRMQGMKDGNMPESWLDAFYLLEDFLIKRQDEPGRILVFIDEVQWLDTPRSGFMTGLEAFWNGWACHRHDVMVIVCGSSSSWILDNLVNNRGGLYNRVTYQINLQPFTLGECEELFVANGVIMSRYDITQAYMMVGGIPYYLKYFKRGLSLPQNIDALFFVEGAPLASEFDRLFSSQFANPTVMKSIVEALGTKARGLTRDELLRATGIANGGDFSRYLRSLEVGSFIMRYDSFGSGKRHSLYRLSDPFCSFWQRFVRDTAGSTMHWANIADMPQVTAWRGHAFESVCWTHMRQIKAALGISGVSTSESLWSKRGDEKVRGAQIDLIIARRDNVVNMCEAKFCVDEFAVSKDYHFTLVHRRELLQEIIPKRAAIHNTLITTYGLRYNEYSGDFVSVVTLDELFA